MGLSRILDACVGRAAPPNYTPVVAVAPLPPPRASLPPHIPPVPVSAVGDAARPRGIRNNNPLNIEHHARNAWFGLDLPPSDGRFCRFTSMAYGVRAAALLLARHYANGALTLPQIISIWAPEDENDVAAYVSAVSQRMACLPNADLLLTTNHDRLERLIEAMAYHENGQAIGMTFITLGVDMAFQAKA